MLMIAVQFAGLAVLADVMSAIRLLLQRNIHSVRRLELQLGVEPSHYEANPNAPDPHEEEDTTGA
jgi:hypothetical protein